LFREKREWGRVRKRKDRHRQRDMAPGPVVNVYPLSSYTFGSKEAKMEKDTSVADRLARMKQNYMKEGMRTSVEGILLVRCSFPHFPLNVRMLGLELDAT
jgi:hypothetical protein